MRAGTTPGQFRGRVGATWAVYLCEAFKEAHDVVAGVTECVAELVDSKHAVKEEGLVESKQEVKEEARAEETSDEEELMEEGEEADSAFSVDPVLAHYETLEDLGLTPALAEFLGWPVDALHLVVDAVRVLGLKYVSSMLVHTLVSTAAFLLPHRSDSCTLSTRHDFTQPLLPLPCCHHHHITTAATHGCSVLMLYVSLALPGCIGVITLQLLLLLYRCCHYNLMHQLCSCVVNTALVVRAL